jgi:hypothetical protein
MRSKTKHPKWCQLNHMRRLDFECFILESSDENTGIRPRNNIQKIGRKYKLWRYQDLADVFKQGDKIFCPHNSSRPTLLKYLELAYNKYISYDYKGKRKKQPEVIQQKITFEKPHPINNILGISAEHTISNINQTQIYDLNIRMEKLEKLIAIRFQKVERFIRDWNEDNNSVN